MRLEAVKRALNDPLAQELLRSSIPARLAYTGTDGAPRVVPVGFHWNGTEFVVCTAVTAPKVRALANNPKVALTIDTEAFPPHVLLVRGAASITVVEGVPPEYLEGAKKGISAAQWSAFEAQVRGLYHQMARIAIVPTWAKVLDFETGRIPSFLRKLAAESGVSAR